MDGAQVLTGSTDNTAKLWHADVAGLAALVARRRVYTLTLPTVAFVDSGAFRGVNTGAVSEIVPMRTNICEGHRVRIHRSLMVLYSSFFIRFSLHTSLFLQRYGVRETRNPR